TRMALKRIRENGSSLLNLIDDILDLSRVEAGHLRIERSRVSPEALVNDAVEGLRPLASNRSVFLNFSCEPGVPEEIETDAARAKQVLTNLIGNAVKFTPKGAVDITLKLCPSGEGRGAQLCVDVRDSGIGIDPALQAALFQPFTQLDASINRR